MGQTYLELADQVQDIQCSLHVSPAFIQKITTTTFFICFSLRFPGKTLHLYQGRGGYYSGLWKGESSSPIHLRRQDRYKDFLRKRLLSAQLLSISLDPLDRIITYHYKKWGKVNRLCYFWAGSQSYFSSFFYEKEESFILRSWSGVKIKNLDDFSLDQQLAEFNQVGRKELAPIKKEIKREIKSLLEEEDKKTLFEEDNKKKLRKKIKMQADLKRFEGLERLKKDLHLEKISLSERSFEIFKRTIKFDEGWSYFKRRSLLFDKIKSLEKGKKILEERLILLDQNLEKKQIKKSIKFPGPSWIKANIRVIKKVKNLDLFRLEDMTFAVGRNAQENDFLRNSWGKKNDYWAHAEHRSAPHCVIKTVVAPTFQHWRTIASVMMERMGISEIDLIITHLKNVKGSKGVQGKVTFKGEKRLFLTYHPDWKSFINQL